VSRCAVAGERCKLPCGKGQLQGNLDRWETIRSSRTARASTVSVTRTILQAYANPIRVFDLDEGFTMVIGANLAAIIYEIGVVDGVSAAVIVHAMRAREKFLR
jgi:hypothetical protein